MKIESPGPQLRPIDIQSFEHEIGAKLPEDYRVFMLEHNGGIPHPRDFNQKIGDEMIVNCVQRFYPLLPKRMARHEFGLREALRDAQQELGSKWLPIGRDCGGEWLVLRLREKPHGEVKVTDGCVEYLGHPAEVRPLAKSFTALLAMLYDRKAPEPPDPVLALANSGSREDLKRYLAAGGKLTDTDNAGMSLALCAVARGNLEIVKVCLEMGAVMPGAVSLAVRTHKWEIMRLLVENGSNPNEIHPAWGETPLQSIMGVWGKAREEIEDYLRKHGAKD